MSWKEKLLREAGDLAVRVTGRKAARKAAADDLIAARRAAQAKPKPTATVNIGLDASEKMGGKPLKKKEVLAAVRATGRRPKRVRRITSASEPTLAFDVRPPLSKQEAHDLSVKLKQEGIAQHLGGGEGLLAGPEAAGWGDFSPAFFYLQAGDTLGSGMMTDRFRAGATRDELTALADKWGRPLDPAALDINLRMRDEALAAGRPLPESLGQFTGNAPRRDPAALQAYREAERRLAERGIAALGRERFGLRELPQYLEQLPPEEELVRTLRQTELPSIGHAPSELEGVGGRGVHISQMPGLSHIDPSFYGTGHRGEEYARVTQSGAPSRTFAYMGPEGTISPEPSVLGVVGDEMRRGPRYAYETQLEDLYDIAADPEQLVAMSRAFNLPGYKPVLPDWAVENKLIPGSRGLLGRESITDYERWIKERGYKGYSGPHAGGRSAALYGRTEVSPISDEPIDDWRRKFAVGGRVR